MTGKAMIISVGGSPEPIVFTIKENRPDFVCFFASEQSVDKVGEIKNGLGFSIRDCKVLVRDHQNILECYRRSLECIERVREAGYNNGEVLVDFTGGTKPMSAALFSVTLAEGCSFVYVGGNERDKNSLGIVKEGTEKIIPCNNPWDLYFVEQRKNLCLFFNRYQFAAGREIISGVLDHCREESPEKDLFEGLKLVVEGYFEWDRFKHKEARELLAEARELLTVFARLTRNVKAGDFLAGLEFNLQYLNEFSRDTRGYKDLSRWHVLDMLGNAHRRFREGRYDDAIARLYRVLEMSAQWKLNSAHGIDTSSVPANKVPEAIRAEYIKKYSRGDILQLPLTASFRLLHVLGDPMGNVFNGQREEVDKILHVRNYSILAHGIQPVGAEPFKKFAVQVMNICHVDAAELPEFPMLIL
ncbi:MAG: TIGR02710 family CRISPR-associated CARF protein [Bacillota bacterium]